MPCPRACSGVPAGGALGERGTQPPPREEAGRLLTWSGPCHSGPAVLRRLLPTAPRRQDFVSWWFVVKRLPTALLGRRPLPLARSPQAVTDVPRTRDCAVGLGSEFRPVASGRCGPAHGHTDACPRVAREPVFPQEVVGPLEGRTLPVVLRGGRTPARGLWPGWGACSAPARSLRACRVEGTVLMVTLFWGRRLGQWGSEAGHSL